MTATNHALTGAVIALAVHQPAIAIPLAFLSHFVLDAFPHFGIYEEDVLKRNKHPLFRGVVGVDTIVAFGVIIGAPFITHIHTAWGTILACMLAAILPDSVWIWRYIKEIRTQIRKPHNWFTNFHQKIQWSETPWGLSVEAAWFAFVLALIGRLSV